MNRSRLFQFQTWLSVILVGATTFYFGARAEMIDLFKVVIAPFGAVSLLIFGLFLSQQKKVEFEEGETYGGRRLLRAVGLAAIVGLFVLVLVTQLGSVALQWHPLIFAASMLTAGIFFLSVRVRNLASMSALTGIGEGLALVLLFFA
ncbi:MAG: hypothetical protein AAGJ79_09220 [Verrucomicrobiota bacterium]